MRVCAEPGCPALTNATRCDKHRKQKRRTEDARRPNARARGYDKHWQQRRADFLRAFPVCIDCGAPATVADHSPRTRTELIAAGVPDPDAFGFLEPRCAPCHNRKTASVDGGFGRPVMR